VSGTAAYQPQRIVAALGKIGSSNDHEALMGARMAAKMVRDAGMTWEQVISSAPLIRSAPTAPDAPVQMGSTVIFPPVGQRWIESALYLIRDADKPTARIHPAERRWLAGRLYQWQSRPIRYDEGHRIAELYHRISTPPAAG